MSVFSQFSLKKNVSDKRAKRGVEILTVSAYDSKNNFKSSLYATNLCSLEET